MIARRRAAPLALLVLLALLGVLSPATAHASGPVDLRGLVPQDAPADLPLVVADYAVSSEDITPVSGVFGRALRERVRGGHVTTYSALDRSVELRCTLVAFANAAGARGSLQREGPTPDDGALADVVDGEPVLTRRDEDGQRSVQQEVVRGRVRATYVLTYDADAAPVDEAATIATVRVPQDALLQAADLADLFLERDLDGRSLQRLMYVGGLALGAALFVLLLLRERVPDGLRRLRRAVEARRRPPARDADHGVAVVDVSPGRARLLRRHRAGVLVNVVAFVALYTVPFQAGGPWRSLLALVAVLVLGAGLELVVARRARAGSMRPRPRATRSALLGAFSLTLTAALLWAAQALVDGAVTSLVLIGGGTGRTAALSDAVTFGMLLLACGLLLLLDVPWRWTRRAWARDQLQDLGRDGRRELLLLRNFADDDLLVPVHRSDRFSLLEQLSVKRRESFEQVVCWAAWDHGPVVAIGEPGRRLQPLGAAREFHDDASWQSAVERRMRDSAAILVVVGRSPALWWELDRLHRLDVLDRTTFLLPPLDPQELAARRRILAEALGLDAAALVPGPGQLLLAVTVPAAGPEMLVARRDDDLAFRAAVAHALTTTTAAATGRTSPSAVPLGLEMPPPSRLPFAEPRGTVQRRRRRRGRRAKVAAFGVFVVLYAAVQVLDVAARDVTPEVPGARLHPTAVVAAASAVVDGELAVVDRRARAVLLLRPDGTEIARTAQQAVPQAVVAAGGGRVLLLERDGARQVLRQLVRSGDVLEQRWSVTLTAYAEDVLAAGDAVFVSQPAAGAVLVLAGADGVRRGEVATGRGPGPLAPGRGTVLVGNRVDRTVTWVRTTDLSVERVVRTSVTPDGLAVDGTDLFVAGIARGQLEVLRGDKGSLGVFAAPSSNGSIAVTRDSVFTATYGPRRYLVVQFRRPQAATGGRGLPVQQLLPSPSQAEVLGGSTGSVLVRVPGAGALSSLTG